MGLVLRDPVRSHSALYYRVCEFLNERRIYSEGGRSENLNGVPPSTHFRQMSPLGWPISPQNNGVGLNLLILKMHKWQGEAAEMSMHYALCNLDCEHAGRAPFLHYNNFNCTIAVAPNPVWPRAMVPRPFVGPHLQFFWACSNLDWANALKGRLEPSPSRTLQSSPPEFEVGFQPNVGNTKSTRTFRDEHPAWSGFLSAG